MTSSRSMTGSPDQEDIVTRRYRLEYDQQPEYDRFDRSGCYVSIVKARQLLMDRERAYGVVHVGAVRPGAYDPRDSTAEIFVNGR
ncbi:hypothetical protein CsatA_029700 [Cannabis sativa]